MTTNALQKHAFHSTLIGEYPDAERDLIPTDDDNVWILDTQVYRMEGLGRFYMGPQVRRGKGTE